MSTLHMPDERSTRRLIDLPSDTDGDSAPRNDLTRTSSGSPVVEKQIGNIKNQKTFPLKTTEAVRLQSPDSFDIDGAPDEIGFNIDRLEEELSVAIAAEFGEDSEQEPVGEKSDTMPQTPLKNVVNTDQENQSVRKGPQNPPITDAREAGVAEIEPGSPSMMKEPVTPWLVRIMSLSSRPVEALSPRGKRLLELCAVSLAVWVPVVWLLVMTGGLGWLKP
jgi:hypothetical protein